MTRVCLNANILVTKGLLSTDVDIYAPNELQVLGNQSHVQRMIFKWLAHIMLP
jgi:hypothetical protein